MIRLNLCPFIKHTQAIYTYIGLLFVDFPPKLNYATNIT